jgi:ParB-like chromosome segregation protein Spo0J
MRPRNNALRAEVMRLKQTGITQAEIARIVGKSQGRVSQLLRAAVAPQPVPGPRESASERGIRVMNARWEDQETSVRLDMALGSVDDLSAYQDCIAWARWEGSNRRSGEESPMGST